MIVSLKHEPKKIYGSLFVIILLTLSIGLSIARAQTPTSTVYYVANDGTDSNDGLTPATAWQTIEHVNKQTFQPGDSILFRRGDIWRGTLYVTSSGSFAEWITFGAFGTGKKPRILGSEQALDWTQVAVNIWRSGTPLDNPYRGGYSYAEVFFKSPDGAVHWGKHQDYDASFSQMTTEYDWSWNANRLYVFASTAPGTRYSAVEVPQRDSIIRLPNVDGVNVPDEDYVEYVAFDNFELMFAMRHGIYPGYNEIEAHGLQITNNHIGYIGVKGGSSAYCIAAWHSDMLIQNNIIHDCGRRGISLNTYTTYTPGLTISSVTIDNNIFYNGFHTTGPDISTLAGNGHTFTNFTIRNNLIDDSERWNADINDGCYASSCTSNSIYISASENNHYSNFYLYNNVIIGSTSRAMLLVDVDKVFIYHNTVHASHPGARPYALVIFNDVSNIDMRNNIIHGTLAYNNGSNDARCVMDEEASSFSVRDYNLYHQDDPDQPFTGSEYGIGGWDTFIWEWDSWRIASGFETNSPSPQNPQFVDRANKNLNLLAGSPAIDAGVLIPGINDNFYGTAPDLGALEFTPALLLTGTPADQAIILTWDVNTALSLTTTWQIEYFIVPTDILTATDSHSTTRTLTLTGLTNYEWYNITLSAMMDSTPIFSDTVYIMPTDITLSLPLMLNKD